MHDHEIPFGHYRPRFVLKFRRHGLNEIEKAFATKFLILLSHVCAHRTLLPIVSLRSLNAPSTVDLLGYAYCLAPFKKNNIVTGCVLLFRQAWRVPFWTTTSPRFKWRVSLSFSSSQISPS